MRSMMKIPHTRISVLKFRLSLIMRTASVNAADMRLSIS